MTLMRDFKVDLFHATAQMFPISISIAYYHTNDRFIDIAFAAIFIIFMYHLYEESKKMSRDTNNNQKMLKIICLCIMLDYIQVIILILNKFYVTNNFYFYKFIISTYPCTATCICCWVYSDIYRDGIYYFEQIWSIRRLWEGFWIFIVFTICLPLIMECANASWIIFLYDEFFRNFRHAKDIKEEVKDKLVEWLQRDQHDLLIKICCINHVKSLQLSRVNRNSVLLRYLKDNVECNKNYYKRVTWNEFKARSSRFNGEQLMDKLRDRVINYYDIRSWQNRFWSAWNTFKVVQNYHNFHGFMENLGFGGLLLFFVFYAVMKVFNIFILPLVTVWMTYGMMSLHEIWFNMMYFSLLIVIIYKLYELVRYEMIMWYVIPDLEYLKCTKQDVNDFKAYYKYIEYDIDEMKIALTEFVGKDVANIVMSFTPDFISIYESKK